MARQHGHNAALVGTRGELEQVRLRLVEWRRHHKPPTPIPADLWTEATGLAVRHGVGLTARTLGLDYAALKRRLMTKTPPAGPAFIELLAPVACTIAECAVEVESSRGARMRIAMKNIAPQGLASIIRDFVG
jgi:hypothetical protein